MSNVNLYRIDIDGEVNPEDEDYLNLQDQQILLNAFPEKYSIKYNRIIFDRNFFKEKIDELKKLNICGINLAWIVTFPFGRILAETGYLEIKNDKIMVEFIDELSNLKNGEFLLSTKTKGIENIKILLKKEDITFEKLDNIFNIENHRWLHFNWIEYIDNIIFFAESAITSEDWSKVKQ